LTSKLPPVIKNQTTTPREQLTISCLREVRPELQK
jgi:hypothetical protein